MRTYYYVYILTNYTRTTFYVGVTRDLTNRVNQHINKEVEGFTNKYNLNRLVYYEEYEDIHEALQREKLIKKCKRKWKEELIMGINPTFRDLSSDI